MTLGAAKDKAGKQVGGMARRALETTGPSRLGLKLVRGMILAMLEGQKDGI